MKRILLQAPLTALPVLLALLILGACSSTKKIAYFQEAAPAVAVTSPVPIRLEPNDKLSVVVKSKNAELSQLFNLGVNANNVAQPSYVGVQGAKGVTYATATTGLSHYTVSPSGTVDFPVLGEIKVQGMTRSELAAFVKGELIGRGLVQDPVVTVEFLNTGFSVLGEVARPGRFEFNRDELTAIDALALAGDLTIQGRRDNVLVARQEGDTIRTYRLDLTDLGSAAASPAWWLKQGDVVYVEPNDVRKRQTTVNGNNILSTGFWVSVASLLTSIAVLLFK